jgi:hypothetical protein
MGELEAIRVTASQKRREKASAKGPSESRTGQTSQLAANSAVATAGMATSIIRRDMDKTGATPDMPSDEQSVS